jgi:poly-gamma-glutamate capsule biosynthesis protein CapA/YwtB (metallophosphatase superfamily)
MKIGCISDFVYQRDYRIDEHLSAVLAGNAFNCVNLEAPVIGDGDRPIAKGINLHQIDDFVPFFAEHKIKAANLANNHVFDYGVSAFTRSTDILDRHGIAYFGAGTDLDAAMEPAVIEADGIRVAFWGFAWHFTEAVGAREGRFGVTPLELQTVRRSLAREVDADYRIVYMHYGIEYEDYPDPYQKYISEIIVNEGLADAVIGTHPHCIQGVSAGTWRHRPWVVFYSLGNFVIPQSTYSGKQLAFPGKSRIGYLVTLDLGTELNYAIHPYLIDEVERTVRALEGPDLDDTMARLERMSRPLRKAQWQYTWFFFLNRARWHFPIITQNELLNDLQVRGFRLLETATTGILRRLHVHGWARNLLARKVSR